MPLPIPTLESELLTMGRAPKQSIDISPEQAVDEVKASFYTIAAYRIRQEYVKFHTQSSSSLWGSLPPDAYPSKRLYHLCDSIGDQLWIEDCWYNNKRRSTLQQMPDQWCPYHKSLKDIGSALGLEPEYVNLQLHSYADQYLREQRAEAEANDEEIDEDNYDIGMNAKDYVLSRDWEGFASRVHADTEVIMTLIAIEKQHLADIAVTSTTSFTSNIAPLPSNRKRKASFSSSEESDEDEDEEVMESIEIADPEAVKERLKYLQKLLCLLKEVWHLYIESEEPAVEDGRPGWTWDFKHRHWWEVAGMDRPPLRKSVAEKRKRAAELGEDVTAARKKRRTDAAWWDQSACSECMDYD